MMKNVLKLIKNVLTNVKLLLWLFCGFFFTYYSAFYAQIESHKLIFTLLSALCIGIFVNLYTNMFGTSKTPQVLDALYDALNDYYYLGEQRSLTNEEAMAMRKLVRIIKILDTDDSRIELFRKYKKEQIFIKTQYIQNSGQVETFNTSQLNIAEMVLNSWNDPKNIQSTGSANTMIDPILNQKI
ncbi:MAG: hypothetical protein IPG12_16985 [Saprospiraceae bacterium]|nr:hypothetical protein [Saprospiraceae bacterium]